MLIVHASPKASFAPLQLSAATVKSAAFAPARVTPLIESACVPTLITVSPPTAECSPTICSPKRPPAICACAAGTKSSALDTAPLP